MRPVSGKQGERFFNCAGRQMTPKPMPSNLDTCVRVRLILAHAAHDRRFADGQGLVFAGAWLHWAGNEDDAHLFRRQRGRYQVGVTAKSLPCGAAWSLFICPRCGGRAQRLRLLDDRPACGKCVRASGLIYRSQSVRTEKRETARAPRGHGLLGHRPHHDKATRRVRKRTG